MNATVPGTELAIATPQQQLMQPGEFTKEDIELIKADICKGATDAELRMFLKKCRHSGLDPFLKQIYSIQRWQAGDSGGGKMVHQTQVSIDGARLSAIRTGQYEGQLGPYYCGPDAIWREIWLEDGPPAAAKVGVLRRGLQPLFATARYASYVQTKKDGKPNQMWTKMPDTMLAKCAEMLALRKAFPMELAGCYSSEEMGQASNDTIEVNEVGEVVREYSSHSSTPPAAIPEDTSYQERVLALRDEFARLARQAFGDNREAVNGWAKAEGHSFTSVSTCQKAIDAIRVLAEANIVDAVTVETPAPPASDEHERREAMQRKWYATQRGLGLTEDEAMYACRVYLNDDADGLCSLVATPLPKLGMAIERLETCDPSTIKAELLAEMGADPDNF